MLYNQGYIDASHVLGLKKTAAGAGWFARKAVPKMKEFGRLALTNMIGQPKQFGREIMSGKAFGSQGLISKGMQMPGVWNKALFYGFPAVSAISTLRSDDPDKAGSLGALAGGTLLGSAAFGPLGMLGAYPAGFAGDAIGRRLVRGTQRLLGVGNRATPQYTSLQQPQQPPQPWQPPQQPLQQ